MTDLNNNPNNFVKTDFTHKCTSKEGCAVPYEGLKTKVSPREICDARCRPLTCVWLSVENSTHMLIQCGRKPPIISKEKAHAFLHKRRKRGWFYELEEECRTGCSWEEVDEVKGGVESNKEYMRWYVCNHPSSCPSGQICSVTGSYSNSKDLIVTCSVNGGWGSWQSWGACSVTCESGTKRRYRYCNDPSPVGNGAYCSGSNSVTTTCRPCSDIANCQTSCCNTAIPALCLKCSNMDLYKLDDSDSRCTRKCSWENRWCWPGTCNSEYARTCACSAGFTRYYDSSSATCQPNLLPNITSCSMRVTASSGASRMSPFVGSSHCDNQQDFYGNFQIDSILTSTTFDYTIDVTHVTRPAFVVSEVFGITDVQIHTVKKTVTGYEAVLATKTIHSDPNSDSPQSLYIPSDQTIAVSHSLSNGQRLCLRFHPKAGGRFISKNMQTHSTRTERYTKTERYRDLCYIYDSAKPEHCSVISSCTDETLTASSRITRSGIISLSTSGWTDPFPAGGNTLHSSGIESFRLTIHDVKESGSHNLFMDSGKVAGTTDIDMIQNSMISLQLPEHEPALYGLLLEVKDVANNVRQTRRFILYDNSSLIKVDSTYKLHVSSAAVNTNYTWQTAHRDVCVSWRDRYYNNKFVHFNPLRPIQADGHGLVQQAYDQTMGTLPVTGTPNVHGISMFSYELTKETFGQNITISSDSISNVSSQSVCIPHVVVDGDIYIFMLNASDIVGNAFHESIQVFIDASPPVISNAWLVREGHQQLFVHNSTDLFRMQLEFDSYDTHSGLIQVLWWFYETDPETLLGQGAEGVRQTDPETSCQEPQLCLCPFVGSCQYFHFRIDLDTLTVNNEHIGNHNRMYRYEIEVTNAALLTTSLSVDVHVDESPPEDGVVYEGTDDQADVDYTSGSYIHVHWHGFLDHESGIEFYRVALATRCAQKHEMTSLQNFTGHIQYKNTTLTSTQFEIQTEGKYFVTVLAFNRAMEPSSAICSDGFRKSDSPPEITDVTLSQARASKHTVCYNHDIWLISAKLTRTNITGVSSCSVPCTDTTNGFELNLLSLENSTTETFDVCSLTNLHQFYLPIDTIRLTWSFLENIIPLDAVYVGFGSTSLSADSPDLQDFQSVQNHSFFKQRHLGFTTGTEFYIFIKALNKAGLSSTALFGPVVIDESSPICPSSLQTSQNGSHLVINLNQNTFTDDEQQEQVSLISYRIHFQENDGNLGYSSWETLDTTICSNISECFVFSMEYLQELIMDVNYPLQVELHVFNIAGYYCTVMTETIYIPTIYRPSIGSVKDIHPGLTAEPYIDQDVSFSPTEYCVAWAGVSDHMANVTVEVGLGSSPDSDDIQQFLTVGNQNFICQSNASLAKDNTYFAVLRVNNSAGTALASSDGFKVLSENDVVNAISVFDGPGCTSNSFVCQWTVHPPENDTSLRTTATCDQIFHVAYYYTVQYPEELSDVVAITSDDVVLIESKPGRITFSPFVYRPVFVIVSNQLGGAANVSYDILRCQEDVDYHFADIPISLHWQVEKYSDYITHFEISLFINETDSNSASVIETIITPANTRNMSLTSSITDEKYVFVEVRPCFGTTCLAGVVSDGFRIELVPDTESLKAVIMDYSNNCSNVNVSWGEVRCSRIGDSNALFYQWRIADDGSGISSQQAWTTHVVEPAPNHEITACVQLSTDVFAQRFICLQTFCHSGSEITKCEPLQVQFHQNEFPKDIVYDIDVNSVDFSELKLLIFSSNIGEKLNNIHDNELDYSRNQLQLGAFMIGLQDRDVTWYLMTKKEIPNDACEVDINCFVYAETSEGVVSFGKLNLHEGKYYICARSPACNRTRQNFVEHFEKVEGCSDGLIIDETVPSLGSVTIHSDAGYISDSSDLFISWEGFYDNFAAHGVGMLQYRYAIGSYPGGKDSQAYKEVGEKQTVLLRNKRLTPGIVYYAMVEARDKVNLTTTAISDGVLFDDTPPVRGTLFVGDLHVHRHVTTLQNMALHWEGFYDEESGIKHFEVAIGNYPDIPDVVSFQHVDPSSFFFDFSNLHLQHGHTYYAFLRVTNRAGLSLLAGSGYFLLDNTPPLPGIVREGPSTSNGFTYQRYASHLVCSWEGFTDPESGVEHYKIGLGTKPFHLDVKRLTYVGLRTEFTWSVPLEEGAIYYVTVQACNAAGLCTDITSNGVLVDHSPPIHGQVLVGRSDGHQRYIGQSSHLEGFWVGFHDSHSDLDHYEVCISSTLSPACDVHPLTNTHLSSEHLFTGLNLPILSPLYVTVWAYNKVRLNTNVTSDVFVVDVTPPVCIQTPVFTSSTANISNDTVTQWDPSFLEISWMFEDYESPIIRHKISVTTHHNGHTFIEDIELFNENHTTILLKPEHWLTSGDRYQATVVACNAAGLCTSVTSGYLLVDSTPPHIGGFGDDMSWRTQDNTTKINTTWSGFEDMDSDIKMYYITIGETYSGNELSLGNIFLVHVGEPRDVQYGYFAVDIQLQVDSKIILSIIAENNAGLVTSATRVTTHVLQTDVNGDYGILKVEKHSCDIHYCNKDCTCAPLGRKCSSVESNACNQTENSSYQTVSVFSGNNIGVNTLHSLSSACLSANWILSPIQSTLNIIRMEWSMGLAGLEYGAGVFDPLLEDVWHDIGMQGSVAHCVDSDNALLHKHNYIIYVRAWYDTNTYRIVSSQSLLIDRTPPKISRGFHIKDSTDDCLTDSEFITEIRAVTGCWRNGFSDSQIGILHYLTSLGTSPGASDTSPVLNVEKVTNFTWTGLELHPGSRYYITVTAVNTQNLSSTYSSDGFVVDTERPLPGTVFNTKNFKNHQSQSSTDTLEASWNGFMDRHSHIHQYKVAVVDTEVNSTSLSFQSVGRVTKVTIPGLHLFHGRSYKIAVKAVDMSGQESEEVYSTSIIIDSSPPVAYQCDNYVTLVNETHAISMNALSKEWNTSLVDTSRVCRLMVAITNSTEDTNLVVSLNDHTFKAHLVRQFFIHVFTVDSDKQLVFSINVSDTEVNLSNLTVVLQVCNDVNWQNYSTHQTPLRQITFSTVSAMLQFFDPESDISDIELGVGTTAHGYQVRDLEPVLTGGYHSFPVNLPHGTPIHATAVVENKAGLRSYFRSAPLIIDHTPPSITDPQLQYSNEKDGRVLIIVTWQVEDKESQHVHCDVFCGSIWKSEEKQSDSEMDIRIESEPLIIPHSTRIIGTITCINNAGIIKQTQTNEVTILLDPPGHNDSRIIFLDVHGSTVTGQAVTRIGEYLKFHWDEFDYPEGDVTYKYRIDYLNGSKTSWVDVGFHNYVTSSTINVVEGSECGVEVRGSNERGLLSGTINSTIYVLRQPPILTGTPCEFVEGGTATLNCSLVFDVTVKLKTSYILTVGTELGFSDIVRYRVFDRNMFTFELSDTVTGIFVIVTAVYDTGAETTYRDSFTLNP
ncbi:Hemicentin-1 [Mizuhopecten yessoensis]|uniref:Hemicentin-1 n=3 Tax=Mizuhopecten yessoensis TaxID=6573 RepID=A0A210Q0I7_MIZYE|nr:Hemicentin-1 [Mizuhopecten yessoensis]